MRNSLRTLATCTLLALGTLTTGNAPAQTYMPDETAPHEGTWLTWPHHYTYGASYRDRIEPTWVAMTKALAGSEMIHIIAYNSTEQARIRSKLQAAGVPMNRVTFVNRQNNDVWVRDNGPVFVYDTNNQQKITDWGFNGWGYDTPYTKDDTVPTAVSTALGMARIDFNDIVLEGGAVEVDGRGALMATRSSILEPARNPGLSQADLEAALADGLGVSKFIWLDGAPGGKEDITDMHIDGFARFGTPDTIVTMNRTDLDYWGLSSADIQRLYAATDADNAKYRFVHLPLTARDVVTSYGYRLGYKGSYVNFYVGNTVVLMPAYKDANDAVAKSILQNLYPGKTVVTIDVRNLYRNGGMVHCVTQQQPVAL